MVERSLDRKIVPATCDLSAKHSSSRACAYGFCWLQFCSRLRPGPGLSTMCASPWRRTIFRPPSRRSILIAASRESTAEYLEAYSWMGRAALEQGQYDQAAAYAKQTKTLVLEQLKQRSLDAEPHLPIALGAALEVQSQVLAARGQRTQAVALLQSALRTYGNTSIHDRLQKNLNLLSLQGKLAPRAEVRRVFGSETACCRRNSRVRRCCCFSGRTGAATARRKRRSSRSCVRSFPARD